MTRSKIFLRIKLNTKNVMMYSLFVAAFPVVAQTVPAPYSTWSVYLGNSEGTHSSSLKQVTKENVSQLALAWAFTPSDAAPTAGGRGGGGGECNPIIVNGVMYVSAARNRVYAINAGTGKEIWVFDPFNGVTGPGVNSAKRGVAYWEDGNDKRILFTAGTNLFAINAQTGKSITTFGENGKVSMNVGMREDPAKLSIIPTSPGIIYQDLIIIGTEVGELYDSAPGYERAYNVKTGKLEWTFHTIPHPGEFGYETWSKDSWIYMGGANDWSGMSLDVKRGIVFLAVGSPAMDYYGANRKGNNLFGNSVVALNARTGKYIWHFQTIHHDLWDYDLASPPTLVTVTHNGKKIDAVAQVSKVGFLYLLNRETGVPLFPIEERPVPTSDIPGEYSSPTQPFPTKPAAYVRQNFTRDLLNLENLSAAVQDTLIKRYNSLRHDGLFTPPTFRGTIEQPGSRGGANWGGAAFDPYTGVIFVRSNDNPEIETMVKIDPSNTTSTRGVTVNIHPTVDTIPRLRNATAYGRFSIPVLAAPGAAAPAAGAGGGGGAGGRGGSVEAIKPPWATLNAINLNTGDYEWKIPFDTGYPGPIVTAGGLLFISGTTFRAYDKDNGKLLWESPIAIRGSATGCTYMIDNKQYIAVSVAGTPDAPGAAFVAFALPDKK